MHLANDKKNSQVGQEDLLETSTPPPHEQPKDYPVDQYTTNKFGSESWIENSLSQYFEQVKTNNPGFGDVSQLTTADSGFEPSGLSRMMDETATKNCIEIQALQEEVEKLREENRALRISATSALNAANYWRDEGEKELRTLEELCYTLEENPSIRRSIPLYNKQSFSGLKNVENLSRILHLENDVARLEKGITLQRKAQSAAVSKTSQHVEQLSKSLRNTQISRRIVKIREVAYKMRLEESDQQIHTLTAAIAMLEAMHGKEAEEVQLQNELIQLLREKCKKKEGLYNDIKLQYIKLQSFINSLIDPLDEPERDDL